MPPPDPLPIPASTREDARNRAWRTLWQGAASAALTATIAAIPVVLSNPQWTSAYWLGVGLSLGTVVLTAVVSYVARFLVPPRTS